MAGQGEIPKPEAERIFRRGEHEKEFTKRGKGRAAGRCCACTIVTVLLVIIGVVAGFLRQPPLRSEWGGAYEANSMGPTAERRVCRAGNSYYGAAGAGYRRRVPTQLPSQFVRCVPRCLSGLTCGQQRHKSQLCVHEIASLSRSYYATSLWRHLPAHHSESVLPYQRHIVDRRRPAQQCRD
jgi:hypothetical protein